MRVRAAYRPVALGAFLLAAAGCASDRAATKPANDPLLGSSRPVSMDGAVPVAPKGPAGTPTSLNGPTGPRELPPLASPSPTSTAALAAGAFAPLNGTTELRIGNGTTAEPRPGVPAPVLPTASTGLPVPLTSTGQPTAAPVAAPAANSFEQAQAQLAQLGAKWQRCEAIGGEWKFSCAVPDRANPAQNHVYEASDRTMMAAVQQVLDQVRREQR